jgi:hypothetical protein
MRYYPGICLQGLRKATKILIRIAGARPLDPWGKRPLYLLDRRLGGPQSRF